MSCFSTRVGIQPLTKTLGSTILSGKVEPGCEETLLLKGKVNGK